MSLTDKYINECLFHFWNHEPEDRAFRIFESIVERGLLLSRGNRKLIDRFEYKDKSGKIGFVEAVQNARVCFTDIPEDKLSKHCAQYGKCAVGFSRETILSWGGCPAWYLPNYYRDRTLQDHAGAFVRGLGEAIKLIKLYPSLLKQTGIKLALNGVELSDRDASERLLFAEQSILRVSSFFKSMSKTVDDQDYLYEREWRIVGGIQSDYYGNPFRRLSDVEKNELVSGVPEWGNPLESSDSNISSQFSKEPLIESFYFFNGIPKQETVSKKIEKIFVPTQQLLGKVREYVNRNVDSFKIGGPSIELFA